MAYQDQTLTCRDCGKSFIFTARDQQFFAEKGFTNAPTRCKDCRLHKKKVTEQKATQTLFKITCKKCGKVGEMATEPRLPHDVLCAACFYDEFKAREAATKPAKPVSDETKTEDVTATSTDDVTISATDDTAEE